MFYFFIFMQHNSISPFSRFLLFSVLCSLSLVSVIIALVHFRLNSLQLIGLYWSICLRTTSIFRLSICFILLLVKIYISRFYYFLFYIPHAVLTNCFVKGNKFASIVSFLLFYYNYHRSHPFLKMLENVTVLMTFNRYVFLVSFKYVIAYARMLIVSKAMM